MTRIMLPYLGIVSSLICFSMSKISSQCKILGLLNFTGEASECLELLKEAYDENSTFFTNIQVPVSGFNVLNGMEPFIN